MMEKLTMLHWKTIFQKEKLTGMYILYQNQNISYNITILYVLYTLFTTVNHARTASDLVKYTLFFFAWFSVEITNICENTCEEGYADLR